MERPTQPADIARAAIRSLATRRLPPTPDNFRQAYAEVAGDRSGKAQPPDGDKPELRWADVIRPLIKQWDAYQSGLTQSKKREMLERVLINFGNDSPLLFDKLMALAHSWSVGAEERSPTSTDMPAPAEAGISPAAAAMPPPAAEHAAAHDAWSALRQAVAGNLRLLADSCAARWPDLSQRAGDLAAKFSDSLSAEAALFAALAALWRELLIRAEGDHALSVGLRRLVGLLFLNLGELVGDETWFSGQMAAMQTLIEGNLNTEAVQDAERALRELVFKQGLIKGSLDEAKEKLRSLIDTFVDRIGTMSNDADGYHARIGVYSEQIGQARDIGELGAVLDGLTSDMDAMRRSLRSSHLELQDARAQAEQAQQRIQALENELAQVSNLVREDQLTGALNRRGLEEAYAREEARAERLAAPLSIALLDIDHFKKLNDSLGHQAGDAALKHLTRVVRDLLRPTDSLARYGGEEFLILLPNTEIDEAESIMKRLQRELTRAFFLHDNEKVLITFSAGVAQRAREESQSALIARADGAMYRAKAAGRNRVERG